MTNPINQKAFFDEMEGLFRKYGVIKLSMESDGYIAYGTKDEHITFNAVRCKVVEGTEEVMDLINKGGL